MSHFLLEQKTVDPRDVPGLHAGHWLAERQRIINRRVAKIRSRLKLGGGSRVDARDFDPCAVGHQGSKPGVRRGPKPRPVVSDRGEVFVSTADAAFAFRLAMRDTIRKAIAAGATSAGRRWFYADTPEGAAIAAKFGKVGAA